MNDRKYIYQYDCYKEETPQGSKLDWATVDVYASNETEALEKVKGIIKKENYSISAILEYFAPAKNRPHYMVAVQCFFQMNETSLVDNVLVKLWSNDPEEALGRAKRLISRKFYRIHSIIEKLSDES